MKSIGLYRSAVVLSAIVVAVAGCRASKTEIDPNRVSFEIDSLHKIIHLPIKINDTVTARMAFDTGCQWGYFDLDSTFCASNELPLWRREPTIIGPTRGIAWVSELPGGFMNYYEDDFSVGIGEKKIDYHSLSVWNRGDYFGIPNEDGLFAIPETDTTHVWELNFEHNFMEIHAADAFKMPDDCLIAPMSLDHPQMRVTIPMKITTSDGDSLIVNREFLVDSGMGWDVAFMPPAEELSFFDGKEFVPFGFADGGYVSRYITDAEIFDGFHIDSLHVYTLKKPIRVRTGYWIGLNFLKRFNVFFDMKNSRMGLQPLKEFHRAFSPIWRRFNIDLSRTDSGSYIVTELPAHDLNHYITAGFVVGDEIVGIAGVALTPEMAWEETGKLVNGGNRIVFDVIRGGARISLILERDPNEIHGD